MWKLETPWHELVARGTIVYIIVFLLMRIWGKKHLSQVTPLSGRPKVLIQNGVIHHDVKHKEYITDQELFTALREQGVEDLRNVKQATIETNGNISVLQNNH